MVNPSTQKDLPYDTLKDFEPVGMLGENANVLVVSPKLGVNNLQDLIKLAKSRPGKLTYGSAGAGGPLHLAAELFKNAAKVDMVHVPYRGTGVMFPDLMSGVIDVAVVSIPSGIALHQIRPDQGVGRHGRGPGSQPAGCAHHDGIGHTSANSRSLRACCARRDTQGSHRTPEPGPCRNPQFGGDQGAFRRRRNPPDLLRRPRRPPNSSAPRSTDMLRS